MMDDLTNLPFQNADPQYWTRGVAHLLLAIVLMATPWNKIYHILLSRNYVYMFVDLEKIKNTTINIDYSLYLPSFFFFFSRKKGCRLSLGPTLMELIPVS